MNTERTFDNIFQCQRAEFRRKKTLYFLILLNIAGKAVLDDLNSKSS